MKIKLSVLFTILGLLFSVSSVMAQKPQSDLIPEADGIYDVAGRPELKVRVIVHKAKPDSSSTSLICSLTDPDSSAVTGPTGWQLPSNINYQLNVSSAPASVRSNLPSIVTNAFSVWTSQLGGKVNVNRISDTTANRKGLDGKNIIAWGKVSGNSLAVTYTWYNTQTHQVAEVDTIMNDRVAWSWSDFSTSCADNASYDVQNILTHEIGHWFGLDDHYDSAYVNNTMYGYGSRGEIKKDTLTSGDIAGIKAIYLP